MAAFGAATENAADFEAAQHRQVEIENHQVRRVRGDRLQRIVSGADDVRFGLAGAFEGVLDQTGDVVLVFDDEDTVPGHVHMTRAPRRRARKQTVDSAVIVPHAGRRRRHFP